MNEDNNKVVLSGQIVSQPTFSHEIYGENFFEFFVSIKRLSGEEDVLSVTMSEKLIIDNMIETGKTIAIGGQFRSYNKIEDNKSKLVLTVFAKEILADIALNTNTIEIDGYICKPTIYRTTPFAREICDLLLAVNRAYNKSDYLPAIAWGKNARFLRNLPVGERLIANGRIQSRKYQKKLENGETITKTAFEISISKILRSFQNDYFSSEKDAAEEIASTLK